MLRTLQDGPLAQACQGVKDLTAGISGKLHGCDFYEEEKERGGGGLSYMLVLLAENDSFLEEGTLI